jgi:pimeloyl-ACP methyl ester carboxylesterase
MIESLLSFFAHLLMWSMLWAFCCRVRYHRQTREDEVYFVTTSDGWRIALCRYRHQGERRAQCPILLCHGLGSSRYGFDLGEAPSLAVHMARAGFDVWSLELRGHGRSERPLVVSQRHFGWSFDDYLYRDLPAAINKVKAITGDKQLHMIGHSMGGMLCLCHAGLNGSDIRSLITIGSSLVFTDTGSDFGPLLTLKPLARVFPAIPVGVFSFMLSPLTGRIRNRFEGFLMWCSNVAPMVTRLLYANTFHAVSSPVLLQLSTAFETGGLRMCDREVRYLDQVAHSPVPTLFLAGDHDRQCPPLACKRTYEQLTQHLDTHQMVVFGKESGQRDHYGHFDLLLGKRAVEEVYPVIEEWLLQHDRTV